MKRYRQFSSHLNVLKTAKDEDISNTFIVSGIIDKFFIQFELGWKLYKDLLKYEGRSEAPSGSPREIIKAAYKIYDFLDEEKWLLMLSERNNMAYLYDENEARLLVDRILEDYIDEFDSVCKSLMVFYGEEFLKAN